ncbi:MAG TPA: site-2 protease family protein [Pirellulales bacterium]|nr:site-2 protease family protein [Pirellulales bacterium]
MLTAEPNRTHYDVNFSLLGTHVRIHPLFWFAQLVLAWNPKPAAVLVWMAAAVISLLVHEFGHVLAMRSYGVTSHMVFYAIGGVTIPERQKTYSTFGQVWISLAGPLAGLALFVGVIAVGQLSGHPVQLFISRAGLPLFIPTFSAGDTFSTLDMFVFDLLLFNLYWSVLNLMPVFPLDGGHVARALLVAARPRDGVRQSLLLSAIVAGGLAAIALLRWQEVFMALVFGYLAVMSYRAYQPAPQSFDDRW